MTYELPTEIEPESKRLWIMGGMTKDTTLVADVTARKSVPPSEMIVLSFDDLREPSPLRLLAMEWAVDHTSKNDKGLADLPKDLREELESRSFMGEQRRSKWMK